MKNRKPLYTKLFSIGAGLFLLSGFSVSLTKVSNIGPVYATGSAVGDTFTDDNGINYEITAVGDTNTVKVGDNTSFEGTSANIPATVTYEDVTFDVTGIAECAFWENSNLTEITIPSSVTFIYTSAFDSCTSLSNVVFEEGSKLESIGSSAFVSCSFTEFVIPKNVTYLGGPAFSSCEQLSIVKILASEVPSVGYYPFYPFSKLEKIYVPENSVDAYKAADWWSTYKNIIEGFHTIADILPDNFPTTEATAWVNPAKSSKIFINEGQLCVKKVDGLLQESDNVCSISDIVEKDTDNNYIINGTLKIKFVMYDNTLSSIVISCDSIYSKSFVLGTYTAPGPAVGDTFTDNDINYEITAVGDTNTVKVGDNKGFTGTSLNIPDTVTYKDVTFNVTELSEKAFMDCTAIESVTLPSNLVSIPKYLFDGCSKLANITFPTTLENIGKYAFRGCHFTSVTIPASVKTMGDSFANNQNLQTVICEPLTPPTASESIFSACYQLTSIQVHLSAIDAYKNAKYWSDHVDKIESIEDYVTEISMKTNPNKTEYLVGEELDLTGAEIRVGTAKGSITSVAIKADMVTGYDKNKVGEQTLTVTYEGKTTTFKVTVKEAPLPPEPVNDGLSGGAIAGIAIGAVAGVALISYVVMFAVYAKTGKGLKFLFGSFDWLKKLFKMK